MKDYYMEKKDKKTKASLLKYFTNQKHAVLMLSDMPARGHQNSKEGMGNA